MGFITTMMQSTAVVRRPRIGRDAVGGVTQDPWQTLTPRPLPCTVTRASGAVRSMYGQMNMTVTTSIGFAQDPGAEVNDTVDTTDRNGLVTRHLVRGKVCPSERFVIWWLHCESVGAPS